LAELARRGHAIVEEPGRRIVAEELRGDGAALPWRDAAAFARRAVALASADHAAAAELPGPVFFDRGHLDAVAALAQTASGTDLAALCRDHRYNRRVFLAPPWPEIYVTDRERRHGFDEAVAEYERLAGAYALLGYECLILPQVSVEARADFVLMRLSGG
jgi:predicted ATPase